ncbi:MAG TPA: DNA polymerase III subunit delta [Phycisphaerae bacterium]
MKKTSDANAPPVVVICSAESFLRRRALQQLLQRRPDSDDFGPTRFDGATASLADVLDEVRTVSLLGGARTAIVDPADAFITRHREALDRFCAEPSPGGCLILVCETFDKRFRLYKTVQAHGTLIECEPPKPWKMADWIVQQAREAHGKQISRTAAERLRELCGDSLAVLDNELTKLATYSGARREIAAEDIDALVGAAREQLVFGVVDLMVAGDRAAALRQWRKVVETDRSAEGRGVGGLAYAVRRLLEARRALDRGQPLASIARTPWQQQQLEPQLRRVSVRGLEDQLSDLVRADLAVKTGLADFDSAIEQFILKHAS